MNNHGESSFIFVAFNHLTKWIEKVIRLRATISIKNAINSLVIEKHGIPKCILSDNGCKFINDLVQNFTKNYI